MRKVGLFGGSFDPIQNGHMEIARYALKHLSLDEVQLIPTRHNPWKKDTGASVQERLDMMKLVLKDEHNISINTIEIEMNSDEKNFTVDTLKALTQNHKDVEYYYIMGMDQACLFHEWKDALLISQMVQLVAFQRGGYECEMMNIEKYHFLLLDNPPIYASSSEARQGRIDMLDKRVLHYITKHGLYLETLIQPRMKAKRWQHTCSVAKLASEIAKANHLNEKQAYIAGMFHDIAKEMKDEDAQRIMQSYYPQFVDKPKAIWHQWVSCYVSQNDYCIDDPIVLKAIEDHTTGSLDISAIGKCVYVADKLDPLRGYDSSLQIEICKKDIHEGFRNSLIEFYEFSKKNHRNIDECFYDIYNHFVKKGEI